MNAGDARPEYEALAHHFKTLAAHFDFVVDDALEQDLTLVAASFEAIDRYVDATPDASQRQALSRAIVDRLRGREGAFEMPGPLAGRLHMLLARLLEGDIAPPFADELARFFEVSERLRTTIRPEVFVLCVLGEARCAAEMMLLVTARLRVARFTRFFLVLSEVANLTDKLHDVREDHRRGEIAVRPGVALHGRLLWAFVVRGPRLLWLSPRPLRLVAWGARYLVPPPAQGVGQEGLIGARE